MIDVQQGYENHLPRRVITGRGASGRLSEICRGRGWSRAFVVSDRGVESAGLLARVLAPLADAGLVAGHVEGGKASSQLRATTEPAGLNWRRVGRVGRVTTP